ncbi:uncharacterized protein LOC119662011 [Teleopsis dalmanni]|uniref:uncharacterized protein LOC119662011 n=1 Tax=Teleopsis dalmanni TaxID=139649 RepID=UPI0018CFB59A|nr:uncharacterized protein LOC119662011 [Teleopsis dalmanni]
MLATNEFSTNDVQNLCQRYFGESQQTNGHKKDQNTEVRVLSYDLKPTSDAPAGFLGVHQFLNVEFLTVDDAGCEKLQKVCFFMKSAAQDNESRLEYLENFGVFKKEIHVYREVLPRLTPIFGAVAPKSYYANNNVLIFEDLCGQGYKMGAERSGLLDHEHLSCALRCLATMHAASIVHEVKMSGTKLNAIYPNAVVENSYPLHIAENHVRSQNFHQANKVFKEIIKLLPKYQKQLDFILVNFTERMEVIFTLSKTSEKYQNVFSHGDLWANNCMFKYGKYGNIPIDCRFVDFQLARYAPPLIDVITLLTIPSSRDFREKYFTELLNHYYHLMTEFLLRAGLDIKDYIPRSDYEKQVAEYRIYGLIESCLFSHLTILPPKLTQHLTGTTDGFSDFFERKRVELCLEAFRTDQIYRERLTDMLEDFVDNFVLKSNYINL